MASEPEVSENEPMFERLVRNRDLSLLLPFIFGFTTPRRDPEPQQQEHPDQETENRDRPRSPNDRIILIDPFTQGMVVIEGNTASSLDSLIHELGTKDGQPPASKASIEALPDVEVSVDDSGECVICLEGWELCGGVVKEMPCTRCLLMRMKWARRGLRERFGLVFLSIVVGEIGLTPIKLPQLIPMTLPQVLLDLNLIMKWRPRQIFVNFLFLGKIK
ncbi:hypothetical protein ACB098_03G172800 [Castanea mollissima]